YIKQLSSQLKNPEKAVDKKSYAKVMLIEDDSNTLAKLQEQFSHYFHDITPIQSGSDAYSKLKKNPKHYDVVITDMELLEGDFDDEKQGIDILELCETLDPPLTTRIITALPKQALRQLIGKGIGDILFKSNSEETVIPYSENIAEFVRQIDKEVAVRKKMKGPKNSW